MTSRSAALSRSFLSSRATNLQSAAAKLAVGAGADQHHPRAGRGSFDPLNLGHRLHNRQIVEGRTDARPHHRVIVGDHNSRRLSRVIELHRARAWVDLGE